MDSTPTGAPAVQWVDGSGWALDGYTHTWHAIRQTTPRPSIPSLVRSRCGREFYAQVIRPEHPDRPRGVCRASGCKQADQP